jgi:hypothetical protein
LGFSKSPPRRGPCLNASRPKRGERPGKAQVGPNGLYPIRCGKCETCLTLRQDNWVGRCRAEQQLCQGVHMVTLTYADLAEGGPKPLGAEHMLKRDYQNWIRLLRSRGHKVRYIITGEEGGIKGRVHWHVLLFWYSKPWDALLSYRNEKGQLEARHWCPKGAWYNKRRLPEQDHWPHGFCVVEELNTTNSRKVISYVTKYMLKDPEGLRANYFASSQNIGTAWITQVWAKEVASQGKCPDSMRIYSTYSFPEDRADPKGAWRYRMAPRQAALFAKALDDLWHERGRIPPRSKAHFHFLAKHDTIFFPDAEKAPYKPEPYRPKGPAPRRKQDFPADLLGHLWDQEKERPRNVYYDDPRNTFYFDDPRDGNRYYWGPSSLEPGRYDWQRVIKSASEREAGALRAARQEQLFGQPIGLPDQRRITSPETTWLEQMQSDHNCTVIPFPRRETELPPLMS